MTAQTIFAGRIRIEYLKDPIGIDCTRPEIQWLPMGAKAQTAFRVVEKDPDGRILSDSGKVLSGATAIPESWNFLDDAGKPYASFNHYSYGSISSWLIDRAAGIRVENGELLIRPYPDPRLGWIRCESLTPLGRVRSAWRYEDGLVRFEVSVPCNTQATLLLPGREKLTLGPGDYRF